MICGLGLPSLLEAMPNEGTKSDNQSPLVLYPENYRPDAFPSEQPLTDFPSRDILHTQEDIPKIADAIVKEAIKRVSSRQTKSSQSLEEGLSNNRGPQPAVVVIESSTALLAEHLE
jgi:hypothetical protein